MELDKRFPYYVLIEDKNKYSIINDGLCLLDRDLKIVKRRFLSTSASQMITGEFVGSVIIKGMSSILNTVVLDDLLDRFFANNETITDKSLELGLLSYLSVHGGSYESSS